VEGAVDDPRLHNPLQRQERLGTGWMGAIIEYEGIAVEDFSDLHTRAWQQLAVEEGKPQPFAWAMRRAEGMKNEQVVQEVLLWSRAPMEVRRLCARKEEVFRELRGDATPAMPPGTLALLDLLAKHNVPVALACSAPEARVRPVLDALGIADRLAGIVTAEDVARGRPDPEAILYAAQQLGRPPIRCVLIGNSNASVEAARECGMAVVAVAGRTPVYELTAADLVVRSLDELSFINLKQLFREEERVAFQLEEELEDEPAAKQKAPVITMERPW
jgi:HAD superfamily hydrolase (TIGR01509 family)